MKKKIALVVMPWIDAPICPLGVAGLKAYLQARGVAVDVHYLHLRLADRIGLKLYTALSRASARWPEWLFAHGLFGPAGTGELTETVEDIRKVPSFRKFAREAGVTAAHWKELSSRTIPEFLEECLSGIPWADYALVGFSSSMNSHAACLALAKGVKDRCGVPIVFGGPNVEGEMGQETIERCDWIDFVVGGEGEAAILGLVDHLAGGRAGPLPPRVTARSRGGEIVSGPARAELLDMATLPTPDHADYFRELESLPRLAGLPVTVTFETSRGCWWGQKQHCTFCGIEDGALIYRSRTAEAAAAQIWELHSRYKTGRLYATDLIMSLDHVGKLLPELARLRRRDDSDLRIFYETKANLTRTQLEAFAAAGVTEILAGIESLSAASLRRMRKGVRPIQNIQTLKWGLANGIKVVWNYLYGFPGENPAEYDEALDAVPSLTHLQPPAAYGPVRPDRFSPYHERPADFGLKPARPDPVYAFLYPSRRYDLSRLAYGFEFAPGSPRAAPAAKAARLRRAVEAWAAVWPRNFFASRRGADSVELFDSRPLGGTSGMECREDVLTGQDAFVYRFCETIRTAGEVAAACAERYPRGEDARRDLDRFAARRWLWREDGFCLSLAVPVDRLPPAQRVLLENILAAGRRSLLATAARLPLE